MYAETPRQGPFLYSLYRDEHGIAPNLISTLFTTGFLSGAASGYFIGSVADKYGRKRACLFFCVAYSASCLLTMIPSVPLLFVGRILGGFSTSLLFSVFESWMVTDFRNRGLEKRGGDLSRTFGLMSTLNSIVAIISGVFSEWLVSVMGTQKSPFGASMALLGLAFWIILSQWVRDPSPDVVDGLLISLSALTG
jgi:MFS family permease